ncbi:excisionase family DNA-binding protein [Dehalococcoidia bacterium]|nr:excisionase family DNA-binding protein [Dehalococcoidia bacterium]
MEDRLLTLDEVAWYLRLSHMTVYRMIQRAEIKATKIGNQWRFSKDAIDKWLAQNASQLARVSVAGSMANRRSAWEAKYGPASREYAQEICETKPDILASLERRGQLWFAELVHSLSGHEGIVCNFQALELMPDVEISGKYIALVDDSKQHGHKLYEKRKYLEDRGATVRTFAFVDRQSFIPVKPVPQDQTARIWMSLAGHDFTKACAELTEHLLLRGRTQDTDHFTIFLAFSGKKKPRGLKEFLEFLAELGTVFVVPSIAEENGIVTITLDCPNFVALDTEMADLPIVLNFEDGVIKFRFYYDLGTDSFGVLGLTMPEATFSIDTYFDNDERDSHLPINLREMGLKYDLLSEEQKAQACYRDLSLNLSQMMLEQLLSRMNSKGSVFQVSLVDPFINREDLEYSYGPELGKTLAECIIQYLSKVVKLHPSIAHQRRMFDKQDKTLDSFFSQDLIASRQLEAVRHILPVTNLLVQEHEREKQGLTFSEICQRVEGDLMPWEVSFALDLGLDRTLIVPVNLKTRLSDRIFKFRRAYGPGEPAPGTPPEQVGHEDSRALDPAIDRFRRDKFLVSFLLDRLMKYCPTQKDGVEPFLACKVMACLILDWLKKSERREWASWEASAGPFGPLPRIPSSTSAIERGGNLYELVGDGEAFIKSKPPAGRRRERWIPSKGWQKVVSDYYDENELANIDGYLQVYSAIFNRLEAGAKRPAVDNLLTLSACFDEESTYKYAHHNLVLWERAFRRFLDLCNRRFNGRKAEGFDKTITWAEVMVLQAIGDTGEIVGKVTRYERVADTRRELDQMIKDQDDIVLLKLGSRMLSRIAPQDSLSPRLLFLKRLGQLMKAVTTMTKYIFSRVEEFNISDRRDEHEKKNKLDYYLARVREASAGLVTSEELLAPFSISDESLSFAFLRSLLAPLGRLYEDICRVFKSELPAPESTLEVDPLRVVNLNNLAEPWAQIEGSVFMYIRTDELRASFPSLSPLEIHRVSKYCTDELPATIEESGGKVCVEEGNGKLVVFDDSKKGFTAAIRVLQETSERVQPTTVLPLHISMCLGRHRQAGPMRRQELEQKQQFLTRAAGVGPGGLYIAEELAKTAQELAYTCEEYVAAKATVQERVLEVQWDVGRGEASSLPSKGAGAANTLDQLAPMETLQLLDEYSKEEKRLGTDLSNFRFLFILHLVEDLYGFLLAMKRVQVGPHNVHLIYKLYPYKHGIEVERQLKGLGYALSPLNQVEQALDLVVSTAKKTEKKQIIIVEDGGYLTPLIHKQYLGDIKLFRGVVEQTTKGVERVRTRLAEMNMHMRIPYRDVAESTIKREMESPHVADAAIQNIRRMLPNKNFCGQHAGVIGYGNIGRPLAEKLRKIPMVVHVYDRDPQRLAAARIAGCIDEESLSRLAEKCWLILGATGNTSIHADEIRRLQADSVLVSVSSDQEEISPDILKTLSKRSVSKAVDKEVVGTEYVLMQQDKKILLLGDGFPINFVGAQGIPNEVIDLVLTELYLNTIALARQELPVKKSIDPQDVDDLSQKKSVAARWRKIQPH